MTRTVSDPALKDRRDPLLDIYLQLHYFRRFVAAGCSGEPQMILLHYFYPLPAGEVSVFRLALNALLAGRRKRGGWLDMEKTTGNVDMDFRESGRRFWWQQFRHNQILAWGRQPVMVESGACRHPFESALSEISRRGQLPVICARIESRTLVQAAPYWYQLSRGRFGSVNLPPMTLIILTGEVPPSDFPPALLPALHPWQLHPMTPNGDGRENEAGMDIPELSPA